MPRNKNKHRERGETHKKPKLKTNDVLKCISVNINGVSLEKKNELETIMKRYIHYLKINYS